jgi:hypothetical protein
VRNVCAFLLTALSLAPLESNAGPLIRLSPHTYIEPIKSLSIQALWESGNRQIVHEGDASLAFEMFDYEDGQIRGNLFSCAWMMMGTSDGEPVGVMIWSDLQHCDLQVTADPSGPEDEYRFRIRFRSKEVGAEGWGFTGTFQIKIDAESKVSIAGHPVGVIH